MSASARTWINPSVLKWARERIGLDFEEVKTQSEKLSRHHYIPVDSNQLQQWESGSLEPDLEHLETLAEVYVCPVGYFFLDEKPKEIISLNYRGLSPGKRGNLKPLTQQTLFKFLELADWTSVLIEEKKVEWNPTFSTTSPSRTSVADIENLVDRERRRLGFTPAIRENWKTERRTKRDAFVWWRRQIEAQGIFCFEMKLDSKDIRGASVWLNSKYPFILVNHQDVESAAGRIFTLLHEYAHIIGDKRGGEVTICDFHDQNSNQNHEPFANKFAARMLIQYGELREELEKTGRNEYGDTEQWKDYLLQKLGNALYVSRDVVAIALQELNLAPKDFYNTKRAIWDKQKLFGKGGHRPTKNERTLRKIGYSLSGILSKPAIEQSLSAIDLSEVLKMKVEKIPEFLEWTRKQAHSESSL